MPSQFTQAPCSHLVRSSDWYADVVGLVLGEHRELGAELAEVKARDLLVELLRQQVDVAALVLASVLLSPERELRERLVCEGGRHDEGRVTSCAPEVKQAALCEHDNAVAVREDPTVDLGLDVDALDAGRVLEAEHVDLVIEVADVTDNRVVLHLRHVRRRDDVLVASRRREDVDVLDYRLHADNLVPLHARLQRADRVDLRHVDDAACRLERRGAALANIAEASYKRALAGKHDCSRRGCVRHASEDSIRHTSDG